MIKKLLQVVIPILLPFIAYAIYLSFARRRAAATGETEPPGWTKAPWLWIVSASVILLLISLAFWRDLSGYAPGTELEPPRMIDGQIQPSRPRSPDPQSAE